MPLGAWLRRGGWLGGPSAPPSAAAPAAPATHNASATTLRAEVPSPTLTGAAQQGAATTTHAGHSACGQKSPQEPRMRSLADLSRRTAPQQPAAAGAEGAAGGSLTLTRRGSSDSATATSGGSGQQQLQQQHRSLAVDAATTSPTAQQDASPRTHHQHQHQHHPPASLAAAAAGAGCGSNPPIMLTQHKPQRVSKYYARMREALLGPNAPPLPLGAPPPLPQAPPPKPQQRRPKSRCWLRRRRAGTGWCWPQRRRPALFHSAAGRADSSSPAPIVRV